jgi:hypothetical protein
VFELHADSLLDSRYTDGSARDWRPTLAAKVYQWLSACIIRAGYRSPTVVPFRGGLVDAAQVVSVQDDL